MAEASQMTNDEIAQIVAQAEARTKARLRAITCHPLARKYGDAASYDLAQYLAFETDVSVEYADRILTLVTGRVAAAHKEMAWRLACLDIPGEPSTGAALEILDWHAELCPGCNHLPGRPGRVRYTPVDPAKPTENQPPRLVYIHPEQRTIQ
jgi:hypothetical protein